MSEVILSQIQIWREKVRNGTITPEEQREAIAAIRKERVGASAVSAVARERKTTVKAKTTTVIDSDALLDEFL